MKQYCRYCIHLVVDDVPFCGAKTKIMSENSAKSLNKCKDFEFVPIDAFNLNTEYKMRNKPQKKPLKKLEQIKMEG